MFELELERDNLCFELEFEPGELKLPEWMLMGTQICKENANVTRKIVRE